MLRLDGFSLVVEADAPIVAQELRLRGPELLGAFAAAPAGSAPGRSGCMSAPEDAAYNPRHLPAI